MIDFKKFSMAYELIQKLPNHDLSFHFLDQSKKDRFILWNEEDEPEDFYCLDALISKLELILKDKTKPKYEVGQTVWYLLYEEIQESKIKGIDVTPDGMYRKDYLLYHLESGYWKEEQLHSSREALIEHQIEYWNKLKFATIQESTQAAQENIKELGRKLFPTDCLHERDGQVYIVGSIEDDDETFKCKKCGEFYK
jgi:hypothetical protein